MMNLKTEDTAPTPDFGESRLELIKSEIEEFGQAKEHYVTDETSAGWAFRKLEQLKREDKKDQEQIKDTLDAAKQATDWLEYRRVKRQKDHDFFERELLVFQENQRVHDPKYKLDTPFGKLVSQTSHRDNPKMSDPTQVLNFVKDNWTPEMQDKVITRTEKVTITNIKKLVKVAGDKVVDDDGQVIPGMFVEPAGTETEPKVKLIPIAEEL